MSLTGIVTAGGATAIVIGIALQNVIQDLFSGLSINFDGSYAIGDWLTIYSEQFPGSKYGRVSGITWRTTFLRLEDGRRLMIPNRLVTTNPMLNHSRPPGAKRLSVELLIGTRFPSGRAISILLGEAFKVVRQRGLVRSPEPSVVLIKLGQDAATYEVRFYANPDEIEPSIAQSMVTEALQAALVRHRLPSPTQQVELVPAPAGEREYGEMEVRDALARVDLFMDILNDEQIAALSNSCEVAEFERDTTFIHQGEITASMFVILEGAARVSIETTTHDKQDVAVLGAGEVVGEMSLMTGAPRTATVTAVTPLRVLEITKPPIEALLKASPDLLERFGRVLAQRQLELAELHHAARKEDVEGDLLSRMKAFFSRVFR
jgi:CRP-like cAMP-binding protein